MYCSCDVDSVVEPDNGVHVDVKVEGKAVVEFNVVGVLRPKPSTLTLSKLINGMFCAKGFISLVYL